MQKITKEISSNKGIENSIRCYFGFNQLVGGLLSFMKRIALFEKKQGEAYEKDV